jgi:hypothetical protein
MAGGVGQGQTEAAFGVGLHLVERLLATLDAEAARSSHRKPSPRPGRLAIRIQDAAGEAIFFASSVSFAGSVEGGQPGRSVPGRCAALVPSGH